jgi:hypothetical protein
MRPRVNGEYPEIPPAVAAVAAGRPVRAVWQNRLGGLTCEAGTGPERWFVKAGPGGHAPQMEGTAQREEPAPRVRPGARAPR